MSNLSSYSQYVKRRTLYKPAIMQFDGSTGYYNKTGMSITGNKFTVIGRFQTDPFDVAAGYQAVFTSHNAASGDRWRPLLLIRDSADANNPNKMYFMVTNSSNTTIFATYSVNAVCDGELHTFLASFDGDTGEATFIIDGVDADDTANTSRVAPTTGTLATGDQAHVGTLVAAVARNFGGEIGFLGYSNQYLTNWSDFMDSNGNPIKQDEATWANSGWGSQPLFWNEHGCMKDNKGSAGNMTENGTIVPAFVEEFWNDDGGQFARTTNVPVARYAPAMMQYNGTSTNYYRAYTRSNQGVTIVCQFSLPAQANSNNMAICAVSDDGGNYVVPLQFFGASWADADLQGCFRVKVSNTAGSELIQLVSSTGWDDGNIHSMFFSFDPTTGNYVWKIDGLDAADLGNADYIAPTTGTTDTGTGDLYIGDVFTTPAQEWPGSIGFFGYDDQYIASWSDFFDSGGNPIKQDETTWANSGWGAQPLFWNEHGQMTNNQGSAGDMAENGTIVVAPWSN